MNVARIVVVHIDRFTWGCSEFGHLFDELDELQVSMTEVLVGFSSPTLERHREVEVLAVVDRDGDFGKFRRIGYVSDTTAMGRYVCNGSLLVLGAFV